MAQPAVTITSPDAQRAAVALRKASIQMPQTVRQTNRLAQRQVEQMVRAATGRGTRQQRRMAAGVSVSAGSSVAVELRNTAQAPGAVPAFRGAFRRTGWYADRRYAQSRGRQYPPWVGRGQPSPLGEDLQRRERDLAEFYAERHVEAIVRALPRGRMR